MAFNLFKKKQPTTNSIQNQLTPTGELPFGWIAHNKEFTDDISSKMSFFLQSFIEAEGKAPNEEYGATKSFVLFMEEAQLICQSKGECFAKWFSDCVADQEFIDKYKRKMLYIETNFDKLNEEYKRKKHIEEEVLPHLKDDLLKIITDNPDILQKDIYKMFDSDMKEHISSTLYHMANDYFIMREKSGNTYKLNIMQ